MKTIIWHKKRRTYFTNLLMVSIFILSAFYSAAQNNTIKITGSVTDNISNELIPGVSILIKGTQTGSVSDINGKFSLTAPRGSTLVFSYIGYENFEVLVNTEQNIDVHLKILAQSLDAVVVIGYGSTTKREVTGSIATLKSDKLSQGSFTNAAGLLQGKVAGLSIINPNGSDPMANYQMILRGTNTLTSGQGPLVVIDGVAGADMKDINYQEVESMDILKDGSAAAIYGTRGTNGVIIITTKRAKSGRATIEYQGLLTSQVAPRMVKNLNAAEFTDAINTYMPDRAGSIYEGNTDWFKEVTRETPLSQKHNLAISGGNEQFSHRTIINIEQNQGLLKNNDLSKILAKTNIQQVALNGLLTINYNAMYSIRKYNPANYGIFYQSFIHNPTEPVYDSANILSGGYNRIIGIEYYNPVSMLNEQTNEGETNDLGGNIRASLKIPGVEGLKWDNFISYVKSMWESNIYRTRYYPSVIGSKGVASISTGGNTNLQYESSFNYTKSIGRNMIQALAGYTFQELGFHSSGMTNKGFDTDLYGTNNIGVGTGLKLGTGEMNSNREKSNLLSFFGRVMYNFEEKYLLSASLRREGSSRFGVNQKWGWFPAVSMGWRLNQESFMKNITWMNELKLRVGYGATGNQEFDNYQSLIMMGNAGKFYYNGNWINTYQPVSNPNPNLRWEKKQEINTGLDFALLNNRVSGTIEYYYRQSTDLLYSYNVSVPPYLYTQMYTNVGSISNKGIEMTLTVIPVETRNFRWSSDITFSRNSNKLVKFSNEEFKNGTYKVGWLSGAVTAFSQRMEEGKSLGTFYGPVFLGVDEKTGKDTFLNQDSISGKVPEDQWEPIGNAYPDFIMGWSNSFVYKQWDVSFSLRASIGGEILNTYRLYYENFSGLGLMNILKSQLDNPSFTGDAIYSSKYIEDGSFLKMDNITVGYNMAFKSKYISKMRLYGAAQDVFCLTKYKGVNPEVSMSGLAPGIENMSYYPITTGLTFGLNVTF